MLEQLSREKKVVGLKQSRKAVEGGTAVMAFVAEDADAHLRTGFIALCRRHGVPVFHVQTMAQLGRACGIDIGSGFAALIASKKA